MNIYNPVATYTSPFPTYIVGRWYPFNYVTAGAGVVGQDTIQLVPFVLQRTMTISDLGARVTTALAANNIQLAVYASDANNLPTGAALATTGNIDVTALGAVSGDIVGTNVTLQPDLYYAGVNHSGALSIIQGIGGITLGGSFIGSASLSNVTSGVNAVGMYLSIAQIFNTWPDLTSAAFTTVTPSSGPMIFGKAA